MKTLLKLPFKILAIPLIVVLTILCAVLRFFAWLSGSVFAIVSFLSGICGVILLFQGEILSGICVLIVAFAISPFGIPAIAEFIIGLFDGLNDSLKYFITI